MTVDLHVHTAASDGNLTAAEVVELALASDLSAISVTDHDSVEGIAPALTAASGTSLRVIPGVELSSSAGDLDAHILGYFIDHTDVRLLAMLASLRVSRLARAESMVAALRAAGYKVTIEQVVALADPDGAVGRSHLARALVDTGQVGSVGEAFRDLIGRSGRFYVAKPLATPRQAIEVIRAAGGVAVLAHPGISGTESMLDELVACGLGGVEAYHVEHTPEQREHFARIASERGLVATGGSDFHGPGSASAILGASCAPDGAVRALEILAGRKDC